jgi:alkyl hydroperoxide reductase subunit AhpC
VYAISAAAEDIPKMLEAVPVEFPLYADPNRPTIKAWGVADPTQDIAVPATFIVDTDGKVRYRHVGENMTDRAVMDDVLTVLRYLGDG